MFSFFKFIFVRYNFVNFFKLLKVDNCNLVLLFLDKFKILSFVNFFNVFCVILLILLKERFNVINVVGKELFVIDFMLLKVI